MNDIDKLIHEYSKSYCESLEWAYGTGMMSEGGGEAIEKMVRDIPLSGFRVLDVGCGLGGVACYLASQYQVEVIG